MSQASHMAARLGKLYGVVWSRMHFLNNRPTRPSVARPWTVPQGTMESLEPRLLLSGVTFAAKADYPAGSVPYSVAVGDFNGDGKQDLVVANIGTSSANGYNVSVLLGNGNGTFQEQKTFAVGVHPTCVVVADVNGDGKKDLIVTNSDDSNVGVLLGNGDGTFQPQKTYRAGISPWSVAVADVNGDGNLDLAVANFTSSGTVSVLLGKGDGSFQEPTPIAVGSYPRAVAAADINGDNKKDLVVANWSDGTASVLLGDGSGKFQLQQTVSVGSNPSSVALADLNGDGKLDLALANDNPQCTVSVLLWDGISQFQGRQTFAVGSNPSSVAVADFNADGKQDLAVAYENGTTVSILLGFGNGMFQAAQNVDPGPAPQAIAAADLNGDSKPDIVVANTGGDDVSVLLNQTIRPQRLFAVPTDNSGKIVELDPLTGTEINRFSAPATPSQGPDGLAFDGTDLFFIIGNGSRTLWELNPDTGAVIDSDTISSGSGTFDGLGCLGGKVYILDCSNSDIIAFDPVSDTVTGTLDINGVNPGVNIIGGLSGITGPNALIATVDRGQSIVELDPATGLVTHSFATGQSALIGAAVVNGKLYLGSGNNKQVQVWSRAGAYERTMTLPYSVSALGGDDFSGSTPGTSQTPGQPDLNDTSDSGVSPTDNITNHDNSAPIPPRRLQFTVSGTISGATVSIYAGGHLIGSATASGTTTTVTTSGTYDLADGTVSITARQTEPGKSESADSTALSITVDTVAPAAPPAPTLQAGSDTGKSNSDGITADSTPIFDISTGPYFRFLRNGAVISTQYELGTTAYTTPAQTDGAYNYSIVSVDAAGNSSAASLSVSVTIDTTPPPSAAGALDPMFGSGGKTAFTFSQMVNGISHVAVQDDGKFVVIGNDASGGPALLARFNADGSLDNSFGNNGTLVTTVSVNYLGASAVSIAPDGKIVIGGYCSNGANNDFVVARFTSSGALDSTFGDGTGKVMTPVGDGDDYLSDLIVQEDGKILAAGRAASGSTGTLAAVVRYNADGSLDATFGNVGKVLIATRGTYSGIYSLLVQPDGKILAGGYSDTDGSDCRMTVLRLTTEGTPDSTFGSDGVAITSAGSWWEAAHKLVLQPDGKIVAVGELGVSSYEDIVTARFLGNGALDPTFGGDGVVTTSFSTMFGDGRDVIVQADGKILVTGDVDPGSNSDFVLIRYNPNGSLDASFNGTGKVRTDFNPVGNYLHDYARAIVLQGNSALVVGNVMDRTNGFPYQIGMVRYVLSGPTLHLQAASDTGANSSDSITRDNALIFDVSVASPYFRVYRDGVPISEDYASGAAYTASSQPSGTHLYAIMAVDAAGNVSGLSDAVTVTIDTTSPALQAPVVNGGNTQRSFIGQLAVQFSEDVSFGAAAIPLTLHNDTTGQDIDISGAGFSYDASSRTGTWDLSAVALPDGNYMATLHAAAIADIAGNQLQGGTDQTFTFFRMCGDVDGDRVVGGSDYTCWLNNFGAATTNDFDGDGLMGGSDYAVWLNNFGRTLDASGGMGGSQTLALSPLALASDAGAASVTAQVPVASSLAATVLTGPTMSSSAFSLVVTPKDLSSSAQTPVGLTPAVPPAIAFMSSRTSSYGQPDNPSQSRRHLRPRLGNEASKAGTAGAMDVLATAPVLEMALN